MTATLNTVSSSTGLFSDAPFMIPSSIERMAQPPWLNSFSMPPSKDSAISPNLHPQPEITPQAESRRKSTPKTRRRSSTKSQSHYDGMSPERAKHLERNRIAANKCRLKKKKEYEQIQNTLNSETAKHDCLVAELESLKEEIWVLKNRIFDHAECDDQRINSQLAKMTQNVLGWHSGQGECPSPSFSVSSRSDGSVGDKFGSEPAEYGDLAAAMETEKSSDYGYPDMMFDSFVDAENI